MVEQNTIARRLFEARPYQGRINANLNKGWKQLLVSQMVCSPCGSGKTAMGLLNAREFVNTVAPSIYGVKPEEVGVFWMAMRRNLLVQTDEANRSLYLPDAPNDERLCPNINFVSSFDSAPDKKDYKIRLLICDEAHHSSTVSEVTVLDALKPQHVVGLSATPERGDHHQLCFQVVHRDAGYRTLIKEGYLSPFAHYAMDAWSPENAVATYLRDPARFGKSLFFFRTSEECDRAATLLADGGVPTTVVKSGTDRNTQLAQFETGELPTMISMGILTEGFNCPSLETVFVRDTISRIASEQMAGRVLRTHAGIGIKKIVQSAKCLHPFLKSAEAAEQYILKEDRWVNLKPSQLCKDLMAMTAAQFRKQLRLNPLPNWKLLAKDEFKYASAKDFNIELEDDDQE